MFATSVSVAISSRAVWQLAHRLHCACKATALGGFALLAVYVVAYILGTLSFTRAFNECVTRGDEVRIQLSEYRQKNGQFPERLSQLDGDGLCRSVTRPTLLTYETTKDGYIMIFKDWLVTYQATESDPFHAHK